ncbi:MAG: hypothetical protein NT001_05855 [Candidatus Woesearchaeota archaeon]|nr:hypothetical protein [Candidatus Woesearchaeota archaeon]
MVEYTEFQTPEMTNNLGMLGYNLISREGSIPKPSRLGPEEAIIRVLYSHPDPRYIEGLPVIIQKNDIDYTVLVGLVEQYSSKDPYIANKVGYILDMTVSLFRSIGVEKDISELESTIKELEKMKNPNDSVLNPNLDSKPYRRFAMQERSEMTKRWNLIEVPEGDSFRKTLLGYINRQNVH